MLNQSYLTYCLLVFSSSKKAKNMKEVVTKSCYGYMMYYLSENRSITDWRLVYNKGLLWIENRFLGLRIRADQLNLTLRDYHQVKNEHEEIKPKRSIKLRDNNERRAGLLGCDRAGSW